MKHVVLDIETKPYPQKALLSAMPQLKPSKRLTDEKKIAADLDEKRNTWLETAAKRAESSTVMAIGLGLVDGGDLKTVDLLDAERSSEKQILMQFGAFLDSLRKENRERRRHEDSRLSEPDFVLVTFNGHGFDLGFIRQRCAILNIECLIKVSRGRYFNNSVDVMDEWTAGTQADTVSLKRLAFLLAVGDKDTDGELYYQLYAHDPKAALAYLENDVRLTFACAKRLGVFA